MENENKKNLIVSILVLITVAIVTALGAVAVFNKKLSNEKKQNETTNQNSTQEMEIPKEEHIGLTEEEINEKISKYAQNVSLLLTEYVKTNEIPTWEEFKKTLNFDDTSVDCEAIIDKDKNEIQFTSCKVEENNVTTTHIAKFEKEEFKYKLDVYKTVWNDGSESLCEEKANSFCNVYVFSISTKTPDVQILTFDSSKLFILYKDGKELYVYDINKKISEKINLLNSYSSYSIYTNLNKDKVIGIVYLRGDNTYEFYNVLEDKKLYGGKFTSKFEQISEDYLTAEGNQISSSDKMSASLLSTHEEKIELTTEGGTFFESFGNDNEYLMILSFYYSGGGFAIPKIFNKNKNLVIENVYATLYNNTKLYYIENKSIKSIDLSGKISTVKTFDVNSYGVKGKYFIYEKNNKILAEDLVNGKNYEIVELSDNYSYLDYSTWFNDEKLYITMGYNGTKDGYPTTDENGNYYLEYTLDENGNIDVVGIKEMMAKGKPVLYLYPKKKTNVTVTFEKPELLTTTYPKFKDKWEVTVYPNGDMYDKEGKYYYALYWEESFNNKVDFSSGFYVTKENALKILEEKTEKIGLTRREANEFIMYWLPILEKNEKSLVYFELTEEVEKNNKLIISPKPDSLLRMTIHVKKVNSYTKIKEQKLTTFKRKGFAAVEWGGVVY